MLQKWQIITLKLNYNIYDYDNMLNIKGYDDELEEPQLEKKPNLYLNNYNIKNKSNKSKSSGKNSSKNKSDKKNEKNKNDNYNSNNNIKKINKKSDSNPKNNRCTMNLKNKNRNENNIMLELNKNGKLNKTQNIHNYNFNSKGEDETNDINIKKDNNKTFEEKFHNKILSNTTDFEQELQPDNSLDNLIIDSNKNKQKEKIYNFEQNLLNNINDNDFSSQFEYNFNFDENKSKSVDKNKNIGNFITLPTKPWVYSYYRRGKNNNDDELMMKIKKKKPILNNTERQELFNNLYNDCKKRKEKYKKLSMEKEAKFNTIYTFTPKIINNRMNEKYLKNMADSKFNLNTNASTFYNNGGNNTSLITTTNNNYSLLNNFRIDSNRNYKNELGIVEEENKGEFPLDFMSRLAEYEKIKKNNLEKIKNEVDINIRGNNNLNKNKYSYNRIPYNHLLNNSENYFENKQKNIEKITQNMYEEQGITFQPKTNKSINDKIKSNIIERNKEFIKDKQEKLEKYSNLKEKECTFKPKINTLSTMAILNNTKDGQQSNTSFKTEQNNSDVSKRLFDYQNKYKEKLEEKRSKYKKSYSFKPEISKNTDIILNNKKKMMNQIKENENNLINNVQDENIYNYDFNNINNDFNNALKNNNINNVLLMKQMKLGELEEISKRISELTEENLIYTDGKVSSQQQTNNKKTNNTTKIINENNQIVYNDNSNSIESNNFQINSKKENNKIYNKNINSNIYNNINLKNNNISKNQINNENSDKILELAKNLLKEDLSNQQNTLGNDTMNYYNNRSKEGTNDFGSLMMYNNKKGKYNKEYKIPFLKRNNYAQEYDFDNTKGNKRIMNLNYYDNLLQ